MGFFSKKNKDDQGEPKSPKAEQPKKQKSDKSIKPSAPKNMVVKKVVRTFFWVFMSLLILKGAIAFAQGNRTINQTIINGETTPAVSDAVKGFASDFATEYFTWKANLASERGTRLVKFIKGIDGDMGLKTFDVKGSSKVTSAEVYSTNHIDPKHVDVTVVVWRDVEVPPDQLKAAQGTALVPTIVQKKTYMVIPITLAEEGPVIQSYPRFVSEQQRGDTVDMSSTGISVVDMEVLSKGKDLADSFLKSWYEGNASQLRYFYSDKVKSPDTLQKSAFTYDKMDKVTILENPKNAGEAVTYRIEANVIVKSDLGEPFTNSWILQVSNVDGRLYVLSNGIQQPQSNVTLKPEGTGSPAPVSPSPSTSVTK